MSCNALLCFVHLFVHHKIPFILWFNKSIFSCYTRVNISIYNTCVYVNINSLSRQNFNFVGTMNLPLHCCDCITCAAIRQIWRSYMNYRQTDIYTCALISALTGRLKRPLQSVFRLLPLESLIP